MPKKAADAVSIGKFDILATYTYAKALLDGRPDGEAREKGMVAAVLGAKARLGHGGGGAGGEDHDKIQKEAAEKKKQATITAESFDRQVADKMGGFFKKSFLPAVKALVKAGLTYDDVKAALKIPAAWGSKITGEQFKERASEALKQHKSR